MAICKTENTQQVLGFLCYIFKKNKRDIPQFTSVRDIQLRLQYHLAKWNKQNPGQITDKIFLTLFYIIFKMYKTYWTKIQLFETGWSVLYRIKIHFHRPLIPFNQSCTVFQRKLKFLENVTCVFFSRRQVQVVLEVQQFTQ